MIWNLHQHTKLKSLSKKERVMFIYQLHRNHSSLVLLYLIAFTVSAAVIIFTYIQLPKTGVSEFIALALGLVVWQAQYLVIINKVACPLCEKLLPKETS